MAIVGVKEPPPGFSAKAIALGFVADLAASGVSSVVLGVLVAAGGTRPDQFAATMTSPGMLAFSLLIGHAGSVLGGYVTAAVAGRDEIKHGCVLGVLYLALGTAMTLAGSASMDSEHQFPLWYHAVSLGGTLPACVLGAYLRAFMTLKT
jgi:hypothetical protein